MSDKENRKKVYGLVGEKLGHSFSPLLHERFGGYRYDLFEIAREDIDEFFKNAGFDAVNVTIPYKEKALSYCVADDNAKAIGCVNTLVNEGNVVKGYNTDTFGFEYMAKRAGIDFKDATVSILGSGGTCRTAAFTASRLGAKHVRVVSRHPSDMGLKLSCKVSYVSYDDDIDCDILVNTTPVGMFPSIEGEPVDINNSYVNLRAVIDVVYNPLNTRLIHKAKKMGLSATGGLPMLVAQGFFASKLFKGEKLSDDPVGMLSDKDTALLEDVIASIERERSNIVLIGMPGSGKSTVGKMIAKDLSMEFADTDDVFAKEYGITPAECIRTKGERQFRALEKKVVSSVSKSGGCVIATGGGVVLDPENIEMLSLNGTIVFIHRKCAELATHGRPLSEGAENLKALYFKRLPMYLASADLTIDVTGDAGSVAEDTINSLHNNTKISTINSIRREGSMKILVINGPNLNMLGIREPDIYGHETYDDLLKMCREKAKQLGVEVSFYQSNHEGDLVDIIQRSYGTTDGIVINPGAYTHTSVAILDALKTVGIPTVEVHISDVDSREDFRQTSYIRSYVKQTIIGHGLSGYTEAMELLAR